MLFSIVIPYFNRPGLIQACVGSLLRQTFPSWEAILVDDASDERLEIPGPHDPRIQIVRNDVNRGPGTSRNLGLRRSRGDYILFLDSDDELAPGALAALARLTRSGDARVLIGAWENVHQSGVRDYTFPLRLYRDEVANCVSCGWVTGSFAIQRGICPEVSETRMPWEMAELITEAVATADGRIAYTDEILAACRQKSELSLTIRHNHFEPGAAARFWLEMRARHASNVDRRSAFDKRIFDAALNLYWSFKRDEAYALIERVSISSFASYPWVEPMSPAWFVARMGSRIGLASHHGLSRAKRMVGQPSLRALPKKANAGATSHGPAPSK